MKEKIKRFFASIAAIILAVGMMGANVTPVMAEEGVTITPNPANSNALTEGTASDTDKIISIKSPSGISSTDTITYHIYKVFDATRSGEAVSYTALATETQFPITANDNGSRFLKDDAGYIHYQTSTDNGSTWSDNKTDQNLSESMIAKLGSITTQFTDLGTVAITGPDKTAYVKVQGYGYYYITSTTGTVVAINTTHPTALMNDKNDVPTVVKTEDHPTNDIGDTVTYTVTINAKKGTENLAFHDKLTSGLTLVDTGDDKINITYKVGANGESTTMTAASVQNPSAITYTEDYFNHTAATAEGTEGAKTRSGDNIALRFNGTFTDNTTITVTYKATLNSNATVNENNEATITYGHDSSYESTPKKVYESTFKFDVKKVKDDGTTALTGAKFVLSTKGNLGDLTENLTAEQKADLIKFDENGNVVTDGSNYIVAADDGTDKNTLTFNGLDVDVNGTTYYLYEVVAPQGYNKLTAPIAVTLTPNVAVDEGGSSPATQTKITGYTLSYNVTDGSTTTSTAELNTDGKGVKTAPSVTVQNTSGSVLPSTGGIGTTIFYVIGGVVIAGAVILLIARRRKNA